MLDIIGAGYSDPAQEERNLEIAKDLLACMLGPVVTVTITYRDGSRCIRFMYEHEADCLRQNIVDGIVTDIERLRVVECVGTFTSVSRVVH